MSKFYFDWFYMCYSNNPPSVTKQQLGMALQMGMLTQSEYDQIIEIREPKPAPAPPPPVVEPTPEPIEEPTPSPEPEPTPEEPTSEEPAPEEPIEQPTETIQEPVGGVEPQATIQIEDRPVRPINNLKNEKGRGFKIEYR